MLTIVVAVVGGSVTKCERKMKARIESTIDELWRLWELTDNEGAEDILMTAIAELEDELRNMVYSED